ncbi:MAG: HAD-IIIA family hydrolase [Candidatus Hodarchaeales archaeon]
MGVIRCLICRSIFPGEVMVKVKLDDCDKYLVVSDRLVLSKDLTDEWKEGEVKVNILKEEKDCFLVEFEGGQGFNCGSSLLVPKYLVLTEESNNKKDVKVVFLDFIGTLIKSPQEIGRYINGPGDVFIYENIKERLRAYKDKGWLNIVVTNQGGIDLGYMSWDDWQKIGGEFFRQLGDGSLIDNVYVCPHYPSVTRCVCRKPELGLFYRALMDLQDLGYSVDKRNLVMIGDSEEDRESAKKLGITFIPADIWRE